MPRLTRRLPLVILALILTLTTACTSGNGSGGGAGSRTPTAPPAATYPMTLVRPADGRTVVLAKRPERIVSLSPGATEILFAVGAGSQLVAVDNDSDYPPEAKAIGSRLDGLNPSVEAIAALNPDFVFTQYNPGDLIAGLDRLNIPAMYWDINTQVRSLQNVEDMMSLLGTWTGHADEGNHLAAQFGERIARTKAKVPDAARGPKVYHELDDTFYTVASNSFIGDIYTQLKAQDIAGTNTNPYPQLSQEAILAADPDVIILADEAYGVTIDQVKARPGWGNLKAVTGNRIYALDPSIVSRPGPRLADAFDELARDLYPEFFQ